MMLENFVFDFLKKLKKNNNREWFNNNKKEYTKAHQKTKEFFEYVNNKLQVHDEIERSKMMRIYRDVRFSKDKTPYKPRFANSYSRLGIKLRGGYFINLDPGDCFVAGGFWEPSKEDIFRLRKEIEVDASEIRSILNAKQFKKYFGGKFYSFKELKSAPRGFNKNHPDVDLLRKKGFIAVRKFKDSEVFNTNFIDEVDETFRAMRPFFDLFSNILTTNLNGESILDD